MVPLVLAFAGTLAEAHPPAAAQPGQGAAALYEFRGRVIAEGIRFRVAPPVVLLYGSTGPFQADTLADVTGRFRFKELSAGIYTISIVVPGRGELQRTVDIGPKTADARRRIELEFNMEGPAFVPARNVVSAASLAVPDKARRLFQKAREALKRRDSDAAATLLKQAVQISPQFVEAWNTLGTLAYQSRRYALAENNFREALRHDPTAYAPLVNLGGTLLSQQRAADSLEFSIKAVNMRPSDALAHSQLGQSYYHLGQMDSAERHLLQAKTLDPAHFSFPQLVLADIYRQRRQFAACAAELDEFLRYHPNSETPLAAVAELRQSCRQ